MDFYVDYGFASSIYDDWFWKIFYEKGSKGNKFSIWISDFDVYEEQRHMGIICSVQLIPLIGSILPTEIALKKNFDKNGTRR